MMIQIPRSMTWFGSRLRVRDRTTANWRPSRYAAARRTPYV
jgi:hypothetical protein